MILTNISAKDALTTGFLQKVLAYNPLLRLWQWMPIIGDAQVVKTAANNTAITTRSVGSEYPGDKPSPTTTSPALKIIGQEVKVDVAFERRGGEIASERARQLLGYAKAFGQTLINMIINGDTSVRVADSDGLKKLIPSNRVIAVAANGLQLTPGNSDAARTSQQKALEALMNLCNMVAGGPTVIIMNSLLLARITSVFADLFVWTPSEFGNPLPYFNGVPVVDPGYDSSGNLILPFSETQGTSNDCTSVFALRVGEGSDVTSMSNKGVVIADQGQRGTVWSHLVEMDHSTAILDPVSIAQLKGLRL